MTLDVPTQALFVSATGWIFGPHIDPIFLYAYSSSKSVYYKYLINLNIYNLFIG